MVLDVDALNLITEGYIDLAYLGKNIVMTPHPGEAARLLEINASEIETDRASAVNGLLSKYGGIQLLKGSGTLIAAENDTVTKINSLASPHLAVCPYGNAGMGSGGMGDVLTGTIAGLMAQSVSAFNAVRLSACVHGLAADRLAETFGQRGLLAMDLIPVIREILNGK